MSHIQPLLSSMRALIARGKNVASNGVPKKSWVCPKDYAYVLKCLTPVFEQKHKCVKSFPQNRLSIMAACEDPKTVVPFAFPDPTRNKVDQTLEDFHDSFAIWPLPQTQQMWLENLILSHPATPGFWSEGCSYRAEPCPDFEGRRHQIFPMIEVEKECSPAAESEPDLQEMINFQYDMLVALGFRRHRIGVVKYEHAARRFNVIHIGDREEAALAAAYDLDVVMLTHFPKYTNPFWNMDVSSHRDNTYKKIDVVILRETIGSAVRSCDVAEMRNQFYAIEQGKYAELLFDMFGEHRVKSELDEYLSMAFRPRFGMGIGVTRMIEAMYHHGLMPHHEDVDAASLCLHDTGNKLLDDAHVQKLISIRP